MLYSTEGGVIHAPFCASSFHICSVAEECLLLLLLRCSDARRLYLGFRSQVRHCCNKRGKMQKHLDMKFQSFSPFQLFYFHDSLCFTLPPFCTTKLLHFLIPSCTVARFHWLCWPISGGFCDCSQHEGGIWTDAA